MRRPWRRCSCTYAAWADSGSPRRGVNPGIVSRRVVVSGRVQGVGFRESLVDVARGAGVVGWVRNLRDGTVEALVQGEAQRVDRVTAWCRHGPPAARVTHVDVSAVDVDPSIADFVRRPTA